MLSLRDYQSKFIAAILKAWLLVRSVLAVLPTGGGKTVCFAAIMHEHKGASAAVVHRKEIVAQISCALAQLGVKHRVIAPPQVVARIRRKHLKRFGKSLIDPHAMAGVISVQTLTSKASENNRELQSWLLQVTLCVFDEGHHYVKQGLWAEAVRLMQRAKLLFVTATPERADGKGLGADNDGFADVMIEGPTPQWLIENGYLCGFQYKAPPSDFNVSDIPLTASGDLDTRKMRQRIVESHLVGDVVRHYQEFCPGKRAIVFANDVETARETAAAFNAAGVAAAELNGETDQGDRDHTLDKFEDGTLKVLVNVDLFDEGFDVPGVDAVIMARATESLAKYLQMVGRALRVIYAKGFDLSTSAGRLAAIAASEKPYATVIDAVNNFDRHGAPNWPRQWSTDRRAKGSRGSAGDLTPQHVCKTCTQPFEKFYSECPYCGTAAPLPEPGGRSSPEKVDGCLFDLDTDSMLALFDSMRKADMDDDEFELDMIRRNVPMIGRGAQLRGHRSDKYRRAVLRELIAWWVGAQAGRDMREVHKRFYLRFGIDIGSALTLKAAETDALAEKIKQRFSEDIAA